ncbi:helix-turn-helix transcriptional regulator [Chloroflexia bacterium SDU3-3]|nr:helix-turn-helix transcriptional regulator [Chloroflexia bacterium SDU3-3]
MAESDALRLYLITLRSRQNISQDKVADTIGMARRTYKAWELGETKDIKVPWAVRAIKFLGGSLEHLGILDTVSEEEGEKLALDWLALPPDQRNPLPEQNHHDSVKLTHVIERLRADAQHDPSVLDMVIAYLDGRRSSRPTP